MYSSEQHREDFDICIFTKCKQNKHAKKSSHICEPVEPWNVLFISKNL